MNVDKIILIFFGVIGWKRIIYRRNRKMKMEDNKHGHDKQ